MATSTNQGGRKGGPDLLARAGMADGNRILSQLEHGATPWSAPLPAPRWRPGWLAIVGALLAMTVLLLTWVAYAAMLAAPAPLRPSTLPVPAAAPAPAEAAAPVPAAATIINEPHAAAPTPRAAAPLPARPQAQASGRPAPARAAAARPRQGTPAGDSDVTLLAAIVAHGQRAEPARDVVLRSEAAQTSTLLQRCR